MIKRAIELHQAGDLQQAKQLYKAILETQPGHPDALHLYGLVCHQQGDHETAVRYIREAVARVPTQAVLRNNLGDALHRAGQVEEAIQQLHTALELRPDYAGAHQNLGSVYLDTAQHDLAMAHCKRAVELDDTHPEAWFNVGLCYLDQVLLEDSAKAFREALKLRPAYQSAVTSLMYVLNLLPGINPLGVSKEHRQVAAQAFNQLPDDSNQHSINQRSINKPIRIGYVSGDFCRHAVNYFFEPVIEHHDKSEFEVYCYSDVAKPDDATRRLQTSAAHWRDINGQSDQALLSKVQADKIDILVDLAGYTRHNRLPVFARQAAPVQISWLGFPNTSGLQAMNYRLVDSISSPPGKPEGGTETLLRLPTGFACFRPPEHTPAVADAPCLTQGHVTLGSLHKLEKLNPQVIELWAEILAENPNSRLLLARDQLDEWHQQRLLRLFGQHSIKPERLQMVELDAQSQSFFELFARIDILLDVFPWSGHTLACCALWMGVPVVSLRGNSHAGRMVSSVLNTLDLNELISVDLQEYQKIVQQLCARQQRLVQYRRELRDRFEQSPLRDEISFTQQLEAEFLRILSL